MDWITYAESSGIGMLKTFAKTLRFHALGILAYYDHPSPRDRWKAPTTKSKR